MDEADKADKANEEEVGEVDEAEADKEAADEEVPLMQAGGCNKGVFGSVIPLGQ